MSWNYRIAHRPKTDPLLGYQIHEIYYDDKGNVKFYSTNPVTAFGDIPDELYEDMCNMMRAFDEEPLNLDHVDYLLTRKEQGSGQKRET